MAKPYLENFGSANCSNGTNWNALRRDGVSAELTVMFTTHTRKEFYPQVNPSGFKNNTDALVLKTGPLFLSTRGHTGEGACIETPKNTPSSSSIDDLLSPTAFAGDIKLIANSSVKANTISAGEFKRVFLEESNSLGDGTHVEPVLRKDGAAHEAILREYMGRSDEDLQTYYRALVFTGKGSMPKKLASDAEVVAYVAKTRGAIGYVSAKTSTEGVKTLTIVGAESGVHRRLITRQPFAGHCGS
jgi:hypothetical protein